MKRYFLIILLIFCYEFSNAQISATLQLPDPCTSLNIDKPEVIKEIFDFSINPNPSEGEFSLNISSKEILGNVIIEIITMKGECVFSEQIYCSSNTCIKSVKLSNFPKGVYVVSVKGGLYKKTRKLIVK